MQPVLTDETELLLAWLYGKQTGRDGGHTEFIRMKVHFLLSTDRAVQGESHLDAIKNVKLSPRTHSSRPATSDCASL